MVSRSSKLSLLVLMIARPLFRVVKLLHYPNGLMDDVLLLGLRCWIALVFWQSGVSKLDSWMSTLFLFEQEYAVPMLPPLLAAYLATATEISMSFLLIIGLGVRVATLPLLMTTAVIQFTYQQHHDHVIWALVLLTLSFRGGGRLGWDFFFTRKFTNGDQGSGDGMVALSGTVALLLTMVMIHEIVVLFGVSSAWIPDILQWWKTIGA